MRPARRSLALLALAPLPLLHGRSFQAEGTGLPASAPAAELEASLLAAPDDLGGRFPRWSRGGDGRLLLTWTAPIRAQTSADDPEPVHAVRVAALHADAFAPTVEIERGPGHFVNWADAPLVTSLAGGDLLGAWLSANGAGPYAYGVRMHLAGADEPAPARWLHSDESAAEHGFVSLLPFPSTSTDSLGGVDAVWLDGRGTQAASATSAAAHDGHGAGAMALYTRRVAADGTLGPETELDARVCDCCQTSAARLDDGTLVIAYRDRGEDERRDISFVRVGPDSPDSPGRGGPTAPRPVHDDGWVIEGCPVNGPELTARGDRVACVWYTEQPEPQVKLAISSPGAEAFGAPVRVDEGFTLGRASTAWLADGSLLVSYLVETEPETTRGEWHVRRFVDGGWAGEPLVLAEVETTRRTGFLRLAAQGAGAVAAWTDVDEGYELRVARIRLAR